MLPSTDRQTSCTVLLIEDDDDIRASFESALQSEGITVFCANNGQEGLNLLLSQAEPPQLILLDIMMPVMDGWEFLRARRKYPKLSDIPAYVMSAIKDRQMKEPAAGFLRKPVELDDLIQIIQKHCKN